MSSLFVRRIWTARTALLHSRSGAAMRENRSTMRSDLLAGFLSGAVLIIAIGAHLDVFSTMFKYGIFSKDARLIHHCAAAGHIDCRGRPARLAPCGARTGLAPCRAKHHTGSTGHVD